MIEQSTNGLQLEAADRERSKYRLICERDAAREVLAAGRNDLVSLRKILGRQLSTPTNYRADISARDNIARADKILSEND